MDGMILSSLQAPPTQIGDPSKNASGIPTQRVRKEVIRRGTYKHPKDQWTLTMDDARLHRVVAASNRAIEDGVRIPMPVGHSDLSPGNNRGWVTKFEVEGDSIFAEAELIGEDALRDAARSDVSIFLDPDFRGGTGTAYGETITHVAFTTTPVVPGLDGFVPIAASRKELTRARPFSYDPGNPRTGDPPMNIKLDEIRKALGADQTLSPENLHERLASVLSERDKTLQTKDTELTALRAKVSELEKNKPASIDPEALEDRADSTSERLESLVTAGKITPAVAASLKPILIGTAKARPAFMLSRVASGTEQPIARLILDALSQMKPSELLGEATGPQGLSLSRQAPGGNGGDDKPTEAQQQILDSMRSAAGVPVKQKQ